MTEEDPVLPWVSVTGQHSLDFSSSGNSSLSGPWDCFGTGRDLPEANPQILTYCLTTEKADCDFGNPHPSARSPPTERALHTPGFDSSGNNRDSSAAPAAPGAACSPRVGRSSFTSSAPAHKPTGTVTAAPTDCNPCLLSRWNRPAQSHHPGWCPLLGTRGQGASPEGGSVFSELIREVLSSGSQNPGGKSL